MRQIILDTETTGLDPQQGHRLIEIACIEVINRRKTGRVLHHYLNPEQEVDEAAYRVHGIGHEQVKDAPRFADIAGELIDFIRDAELIMHNAPFDVGFINTELASSGRAWGEVKDYCTVLDTLALARDKHPGQRNSLDALCGRYEVDNSHRIQHGALLDAEILLDVYLAMTGGQVSLLSDDEADTPGHGGSNHYQHKRLDKQTPLRTIQPSAAELSAHERLLDVMRDTTDQPPLWRQ